MTARHLFLPLILTASITLAADVIDRSGAWDVDGPLGGHSGIEHALSVGAIYDDVVQLFATSRVGYTPTLLVAYGGQPGENWFYQHYNVWEKL